MYDSTMQMVWAIMKGGFEFERVLINFEFVEDYFDEDDIHFIIEEAIAEHQKIETTMNIIHYTLNQILKPREIK